MDLSIIVINWNTREMLRDCLQSVAENSPECSYEILVVDNASSDGSQDMVLTEFPAVQLIANRDNIGFARANNIAVERARGRYVLLLNSDTLVHGEVLQKSVDYMQANSQVGAMGCRVLNRDGSLQHSTSEFPSLKNLLVQTLGFDRLPIRIFRKYRMLDWSRTDVRAVETISGCFMMMRRTCLEDIGLLDGRFFFFGEETDWCMRARKAGWLIHFAPVGTITHFGGGSSGVLNFKRDIMLSEATVRLHAKHGGLFSASLVFTLLFVFNVSRAIFWAFPSLLRTRKTAIARCRHFIGVSANFAEAWPRKNGRAGA